VADGTFYLADFPFCRCCESERGGCRMGKVFLSSVCGLKPMSFKISGKDILPAKHSSAYRAKLQGPFRTSNSDDIRVTLVFQGETTGWDLSINTRTRTLYCLVNRATKAQYSRFTLRLADSKAIINDSANLTLGLTDLSHGGVVEICFAFVHQRGLAEVIVRHRFRDAKQKILLPEDTSILALLGYLKPGAFGRMSDLQLWYIFLYVVLVLE